MEAKNEGQREKKYRARPIRHARKALENAFNLSVNIRHAGLSMPSLKKEDASLFIYHKDTSLTASCKQVVCLYMCMCVCVH